MQLKQLTFGLGLILRERVNGWATANSGTPHVYPDHPPLDLAQSSYPRATVDIIGHRTREQDVEQNVEIGEGLVDVTVYATNSREVVELLGASHQAIIDYYDGDNLNGEPYLPDWHYERTGQIGNLITEETEENFTRYNKTMEFEFNTTTVKQTT